MKNKIQLMVICSFLVASQFAIGQNEKPKTTVDYYTTVEKLFFLEIGMSLTDVNAVLKSEPYDILQHTINGYLILEYKYIKKYRHILKSNVDDDMNRLLGRNYYQEPSSVYLMFGNDQKLVNYVTADAMGGVQHQLQVEATATKLGSLYAPCTRNCRISLPVQEVEEKPVETKEENNKKSNRGGGLFGSVGKQDANENKTTDDFSVSTDIVQTTQPKTTSSENLIDESLLVWGYVVMYDNGDTDIAAVVFKKINRKSLVGITYVDPVTNKVIRANVPHSTLHIQS